MRSGMLRFFKAGARYFCLIVLKVSARVPLLLEFLLSYPKVAAFHQRHYSKLHIGENIAENFFLTGKFHYVPHNSSDFDFETRVKFALAKNDQEKLYETLSNRFAGEKPVRKKKFQLKSSEPLKIGFFCTYVDSDIFQFTVSQYNEAYKGIIWTACLIGKPTFFERKLGLPVIFFPDVSKAVDYADRNFDIVVDADGPLRPKNFRPVLLQTTSVCMNYYNFLSSYFDNIHDLFVSVKGVPTNANPASEKLVELPAMGAWSLDQVNLKDCDYKYDLAVIGEQFKLCKTFLSEYSTLSHKFRIVFVGLRDVKFFQRQLKEHNWHLSNVFFKPRLSLLDFMDFLNYCKAVLDTLSYSGGSSTLVALRSGCPVLARRGDYLVSAISSAMLVEMGLEELVLNDAQKIETFLETTTNLQLRQLRHKVQCATNSSMYFNPAKFLPVFDSEIRKCLKG